MKIPIRSDKKEVKDFIARLKEILESKDFSIDDDLIFVRAGKEDIEYSTNYTIADLDYDIKDVVERLKELTLEEYSETLIDNADENPPLLFVFGKSIGGRVIYIKLKIKGETGKKVLCLSFHYAKHEMAFPYK